MVTLQAFRVFQPNRRRVHFSVILVTLLRQLTLRGHSRGERSSSVSLVKRENALRNDDFRAEDLGVPQSRSRDGPPRSVLRRIKVEEQTTKLGKRKTMNLFKVATTVGCVALMGALFAPGAKADDWNRKTKVTFSGPVEIPGVHLPGWGVLPAGTYVFKVLDSASDRHIVQIFNQDETIVYATVLAIPNYRLKATDKTVITFRERAAGEPEAIRAWFYPGRNWGDEFVYPKARAVELAKTTNTPVLFAAVEIPVEVAEPIKTVDAPVVVQLKRAPIMAIKPTGEEVALVEVVTPPPALEAKEIVADPVAEPTLPATASTLPLIGLLGLLALGAAFTVRAITNSLS
jgi:hypothetical protein